MKIEIKQRTIKPNQPTFWAKWGLYINEKEIGLSVDREGLVPLYDKLTNDNDLAESLYNQFK
jgi:hypothetical protein